MRGTLIVKGLMIKNETARTTYDHGTIQQCYENDSKEMLSMYSFCLLSVLLSMQSSTLLLNTTDENVGKI